MMNLSTGSSYARAGSSLSGLGTAATLSCKIRVSGAFILSAGAGGNPFLSIGNGAGTALRFILSGYRTGGNAGVLLYDSTPTLVASAVGADTAFDSAAYYVIYFHIDSGGIFVGIYQDDGTLVYSGTGTGAAVGASDAANGYVYAGLITGSCPTGAVDGIAFYSATLSGANRYNHPKETDSNVLWYVRFQEGSGSSAANRVSGATDLTTWSAAWLAAGLWGSRALLTRRRRH